MGKEEFKSFVAEVDAYEPSREMRDYWNEGFHYRPIQELEREQEEPAPKRSKIFTAFHTEEALDFLNVIQEMKQGSLSAQEALSCSGMAHVVYVIETALKTP